MAETNVPQLIDNKGDCYSAISPRLETIEGANKHEVQWSNDERSVVNQEQCLKSIIISCLPDDIIESVISCATAKETWTNLVHSFEGLLNTKENRIMDLKFEYNTFRAKPSKSISQTYTGCKTLPNELSNDGDFQENSDDEVDERTSEEYLRDLDIEFHERALLSSTQSPKPFQSKNKGLVAETFNWDEEKVSDDDEMTQVKVLMALAD
ncbi:hypothetical protein Tco_0782903 [Tanacetum coccineum]